MDKAVHPDLAHPDIRPCSVAWFSEGRFALGWNLIILHGGLFQEGKNRGPVDTIQTSPKKEQPTPVWGAKGVAESGVKHIFRSVPTWLFFLRML